MKKIIQALILLLCIGLLAYITKLRIDSATVISSPPAAVGEAAVIAVTPAPVEAPEPTAEPSPTPLPEPQSFTLSFVGDCTLWSNPNYAAHPAGYAGVIGEDYAYPFAKTVQYFESDDFTIANFECTLSDKNLAYDYTNVLFPFLAPTDYANIMTQGEVDFVTTANNHMMDCYQVGADSTCAALDNIGLAYGVEGQAQVITTDSGLKLGLYCSGIDLAPSKAKALAAIDELLGDGAEYIICLFHWGQELYYEPTAAQIELAKACIDAGANLIYGSHSHCLQPIEEYNGGLILYSMGNWTFGGNTAPTDPDTAIVQVTLSRGADGLISRDGYSVIPCCVSSNIDGAMNNSINYNNYQPCPYDEGSEGYARVIAKLDGSFEPDSQGKDYSSWYASRAG